MAQTKILLDSNSYFRLAKDIHPLLFKEFGEQNYCLYVLKDVEDEFDRQPRLQSKFLWFEDEEFKANRSQTLHLSRKEKRGIDTTFEFIWEYVLTNQLGTSKVDIRVLGYCYVLGIPVVTDDADMIEVGETFGITVYKTLELMHLMESCGHINKEMIRRIAAYWRFNNDKPKHYAKDYQRLFNEPPP